MLAHFRCYSDNASGETKNKSMFQMFQWMRWLVAHRKIVSGMLCQGRVGHTHTHGRQYRTFAAPARGLRRCGVLEDPGHFAERIRECMSAKARGILEVDKLEGALPWRALFAKLPPHFRFKGLDQTTNASKQGLEACHVFKFVRRESVHQNVRIHNPFCGVPESPRDVVFLVKQYIGSEVLTQPPEICFPFAGLKHLPQEEFPLSSGKKCFPESRCRDGSVRSS